MALQTFGNGSGTLFVPMPHFPATWSEQATTTDAAGESCAAVGHLLLTTGPGTSKTISAAGSGKISWLAGSVTFANAGTTLRVGINDVGATGLEDGTHDVYKDLVGGTDTITASVVNTATMGSGTKTITHGDLVAVVLEMTARGGADSVGVVRGDPSTSQSAMPYGTADTGSGPAKINSLPFITVQFDDGTLGFFSTSGFACKVQNATAIGTGSTPDENALVFRLPFPAVASGLYARLASVSTANDIELILYSAPLGTPVAERTIAQDMDLVSASEHFSRPFTSTYNLQANTDYAIAFRPTTANTVNYRRLNFNTGNGNLRGATMLGTNWSFYSRTDQTGAFANQDITLLPVFGIWLSAFDDAVQTGFPANRIFTGY